MNNYNIEWILNWDANIDIQICLDFYAVITYISDYYSKDDSGTMGHIMQALKSVENESLKDKMNVVANTFLTHRQIGECEAFYKILPQLHMKESNVETKFVPTGFEQNRSKFLKQISQEEADKCPNVIIVPNKDGLFTEKPSMLDKFQRRNIAENPCIDELTYLQFNMKYSPTNEEPKKGDFLSSAYHKGEQEFYLNDAMNLIVTHDFHVSEVHYTLPRYIKLLELRPGEPKYMKRRSRCVIRFHKIDKTKFPHEFHYSQLQLYSKFRNENELMPEDFEKCKLLYDEKSDHNGVRKIENIKSILMPYLENIETQREKAELLVENDIGDILDPALEQANEDCLDMEVEDHCDFAFKDPSDVLESANKKIDTNQYH